MTILGKRSRNSRYAASKKPRWGPPGRRRRLTRRRTRKSSRRGRSGLYTKTLSMPVADKIYTKFRYSEALTMSMPGATILYRYTYQTSLFDPDQSGIGHQPLWRDQMVGLYNKYRVHGIKYKYTIIGPTDGKFINGAILHQPVPGGENNLNTIRERRNSKPFVIRNGNAGNVVIKGYMPTGKPHGLTKDEMMADEDFEADMGSNPTRMSFLEIYGCCVDGASALKIQVDLEYYAELYSRVAAITS